MHADIEQLADYTFSAVAEGYDAFLLRDLLRSSKQDILYIVSDGLSLERTAELLKTWRLMLRFLSFRPGTRFPTTAFRQIPASLPNEWRLSAL